MKAPSKTLSRALVLSVAILTVILVGLIAVEERRPSAPSAGDVNAPFLHDGAASLGPGLTAPQAAKPNPLIARRQLNQLFRDLSRELGVTSEEQVLTVDRLQEAVYQGLLQDKQPEQLVAALLQRESRAMQQNASGKIPQDFSPASAYLLLPYLAEAGLCRGDIWIPEGLVCGYANSAPGAPRIQGSWNSTAAGHKGEIKAPPANSALARILRMAQSPGLIALNDAEKVKRVLAKVGERLKNTSLAIIPSAHAQVGDPEDTLAHQVENCTQKFDTSGSTYVIRMDPHEFALALWLETFGKITLSDKGAYFAALMASLKAEAFGRIAGEFLADEIKDRTERQAGVADRRAREQCKHLQGSEYEDCYFRHYKEKADDIEARGKGSE